MDPFGTPVQPPWAPQWPGTEPPPRRRDPFAVALANASLLGIGYAMLGRRLIAAATTLVSVLLAVLLVASDYPEPLQIVGLVWWIASIVGGWVLARSRASAPTAGPWGPGSDPSTRPARQRLVALAIAAPVLLAFGLLRVDAWRVERNAADAQRSGDCEQALSDLDGLTFAHRVADAPRVDRAEGSVDACEILVEAQRVADDQLRAAALLERYDAHPGALWAGADGLRADLLVEQATEDLHTALSEDTGALESGLTHLTTVLDEAPDRQDAVDGVLDEFFADLTGTPACRAKALTDWLADRTGDDAVATRIADTLPTIAPETIVDCGGELMADDRWEQAQAAYQQLLDRYPDAGLVPAAREGVRRANLAIELARVRKLLHAPYPGARPPYCANPVGYSQAPPYRGPGPHRALIFGSDKYERQLPASWLASDATGAVLVMCVGEMGYGAVDATCPYESKLSAFGFVDVKFRERRFPLRAYELRTGRLLATRSLTIDGTSCPSTLRYRTLSGIPDIGPPSKVYVRSSESDVRDAYARLIRP